MRIWPVVSMILVLQGCYEDLASNTPTPFERCDAADEDPTVWVFTACGLGALHPDPADPQAQRMQVGESVSVYLAGAGGCKNHVLQAHFASANPAVASLVASDTSPVGDTLGATLTGVGAGETTISVDFETRKHRTFHVTPTFCNGTPMARVRVVAPAS
jgi:hypothetical protein